ncbi:MAG: hypothetical protein HFJ58_01730 [Clostridia bacterium]|nr:hypothetical protein [Clostridia bacterium]
MEENKNQEQTINTEELKKETAEAVNQVKDTIKNVDIKNDAKEATGFVKSMFKDPFATIKNIADDSTNKTFKMAIIFVAIWMIAEFLGAIIPVVTSRYWTGSLAVERIFRIIKYTIAPVLSILVLSGIVYFTNKENKKSMITTITSISIAKIPVILASVVSLITLISSNASPVTSRFSGFCSVVSIILVYFSTKALCGEEQNSKFIKKFVIIYAIYYVVSLIAYYLGLYI